MATAGSAWKNVIVDAFILNSQDEVVVKIVKEILTLFKIDVLPGNGGGKTLDIENRRIGESPARVRTEVKLICPGDQTKICVREKEARADERVPQAERRLIKLNLYDIFVEEYHLPKAPWGILHGVRPTKIVHKYIDRGFQAAAIMERMSADYALRENKAAMLTDLAFRQRPFLARAKPDQIGVYIGIPFCLSRCLYCSFPSYVLPKEDILRSFQDTLYRDIRAAADAIAKYQLRVQSIYVGGGTPTSLPANAFASFLSLVRDAFFQSGTEEFTVEAGRPDSVDDEKIAAMKARGVDRTSVNPQTMQEKTLKRIGRNHSAYDIIELFGKFRRSGMKTINMDLIIGLPGEMREDVEDTMRRIVALNPDNLTLHALALKRGSALKTKLGDYCLPDDETAAAMQDAAIRAAESLGMKPYYLYRQGYMSGNLENIGYAKSGFEGLYNMQIMEERQTIIGIGPAATTKVIDPKSGRLTTSFHPKDLSTYLNYAERYMEKRAKLLDQAFGREESQI